MAKILNRYFLCDMEALYFLNDSGRAALVLMPKGKEFDLNSEKNNSALEFSSLAHIHLSNHNEGIYSNCLKLSETIDNIKYETQTAEETDEYIKVTTTEKAKEGYGFNHTLLWFKGEKAVESTTEFFNNSGKELNLEYITSASLDLINPFLADDGGRDIIFHRFKAGWSMEGLHKAETLTELGLEKAWTLSGENLKFGATGSRPVREYHPICAVEDTKSGVIWGLALAHNTSWQMELTRTENNLNLSASLADNNFGLWSKKIANGEKLLSPTAYLTVANGSVDESSNRLLSARHRYIDKNGRDDNMDIAYNEWATTWGHPTEEFLLKLADILKKGKTKYLVVDDGWFIREKGIGDWEVNITSFPDGMKHFTDEIKKRGLIPGVWMEFECATEGSEHFKPQYDNMKVQKNGHTVIGKVINGRRESFFDFRKHEVIEYLDEKVIKFLNNSGFGYIKVDYNASMGIGIDGNDSPGENLREHMEAVRNYFKKMAREVPGLIIENCASGGCRLEPSMMDITQISSGSDAHEGYEGPVILANLHYIAPPRQTSVWCTLKPEYDHTHFTHIIAGGFLGRLCWSGDFPNLNEAQMAMVYSAEDFYSEVSHIIKRGNSKIYRTGHCSFSNPIGTQAVVRFSEDGNEALVVTHSFENAKELQIEIPCGFKIAKILYEGGAKIKGNSLIISPTEDFEGNVYLLTK